jgi:hypothetical protein
VVRRQTSTFVQRQSVDPGFNPLWLFLQCHAISTIEHNISFLLDDGLDSRRGRSGRVSGSARLNGHVMSFCTIATLAESGIYSFLNVVLNNSSIIWISISASITASHAVERGSIPRSRTTFLLGREIFLPGSIPRSRSYFLVLLRAPWIWEARGGRWSATLQVEHV